MLSNIEAFHRPATLAEAVALLTEARGRAIPVAGATAVGLGVRNAIRALVDLSALGLDRIDEADDGLHIGAMVRASQVHRDPRVREAVGDALPEAAFAIGGEPIRNLTTLGGNVVHLTSWSDTPPVVQVLDARFHVQGVSDRTYTADEWFAGNPKRLLEHGDLLTEVIVPPKRPRSGSAFLKHAKTAVDYALVNAAAFVTLQGTHVAEVRISVGAIHTPPRRMTVAEDLLRGYPLDAERLATVEAAVAAQVQPRRDYRMSAGYQRHCAGVVARRCVSIAAERAAGRG